jgi:hypothetical protein
MKMKFVQTSIALLVLCALGNLLTGCASTGESSGGGAGSHLPSKYRADDGRRIEIGSSTPSDVGLSFKNPHMERCWIASDFNFTGYDALYIAPTLSTAKFQKDEERPHEIAKEMLPIELRNLLSAKGLFSSVALQESELKPGARVLKLENTIAEYSKGGGAARYFVGLYGGGQPVLRVQGKMTDGEKTVFLYEARRSGVSAGARMIGAFMKDEDIQIEDIRSMALDVADFMAAIAGKYQAR